MVVDTVVTDAVAGADTVADAVVSDRSVVN